MLLLPLLRHLHFLPNIPTFMPQWEGTRDASEIAQRCYGTLWNHTRCLLPEMYHCLKCKAPLLNPQTPCTLLLSCCTDDLPWSEAMHAGLQHMIHYPASTPMPKLGSDPILQRSLWFLFIKWQRTALKEKAVREGRSGRQKKLVQLSASLACPLRWGVEN